MEAIGTIWTLFLYGFFPALLIALAGIVWRARRDEARMERIDDATRLDLARRLEAMSATDPTAFAVLPLRAGAADERCILPLPQTMDAAWLRGRVIEIRPGPPDDVSRAQVTLTEDDGPSRLAGRRVRLTGLPRSPSTSGGVTWRSPKVWMKRDAEFAAAAAQAGRDAEGVAWHLFRQGSVNAAFEWLQSPQWRRCPTCDTRMVPVFHLGGALIGCDDNAEIFVQACPAHEVFGIAAQTT